MATILIVEDQPNVRRSMALMVEQDGHAVFEATNATEALALLGRHRVDVVVSDVRMPGDLDGASLLRRIKGLDPDIEVVLATAFGTIDHAVDAIKCGAYDYLTKPVDPERLLLTIRRAAERGALALEVRELRAHIDQGHLVSRSRAMQTLVKQVRQLAQSDSTVLITGESGTGKELVARALYDEGPRRRGKFVPVNCGALSESILESELFGHRKGAFTGAVADKKGLLEEADGGVLFLDEIGEMPAGMQVRLLRFLQGGEVRRLGETQTRRVNVRLVAATHRSLEAEVARGTFRQDFYYRINVVSLHIPPLRNRPEDLEELAEHFLRRVAVRARRKVTGFTPRALELLLAYAWPGNVRELENAIERATNLASGEVITEADLPAAVTVSSEGTAPDGLGVPVEERTRLLHALERSRWNQSRAAEELGISRTTLWRKLREHRIAT
ncbi:MAG: sigma-54-dependent Fis family transcriptional regulator [Acidobacteria bacterium]|nr:sigma-54-dependent Fis family transcriptional regulator [Acidobacteriota bacterium]